MNTIFKTVTLSLFTACLLLSTGCTQRLFDFTVLSTKNVDISRMGEYERTGKRTEGSDIGHIIFTVPIVPDMKEAIDRAIESVPGAVALVDGVAYEKFWWIPMIYGQISYVFEGEALVDPSLAGLDINYISDTYTVIKLDKRGDIKDKRSVTKEEYQNLKDKLIKIK